MNWIDIFLIFNLSIVIILTGGLIFKKSRPLSFSFLFSLSILYIGLFFIDSKFYSGGDSKRDDFIKLGAETAQLTPSIWLKKLESKNNSSSLNENSLNKLNIFFPLGGAPDLLTLYCEEDEGPIIFKADRFGFRNNDSLWNKKNHDILLIGDSFAQSACVNRTITQNINSTGVRAVTLGLGGNGPLTAHAILREYLNIYDVNFIVNLIYPNDFSKPSRGNIESDLEIELRNKRLIRYLENQEFIQNYFQENYLSRYSYFSKEVSLELSAKTTRYKIDRIAYSIGFRVVKKTLINLGLYTDGYFSKNIKFIDKKELGVLMKIYEANQSIADSKKAKLINIIIPHKNCLFEDSSGKWIANIINKELNSINHDLSDILCHEDFFADNGNHLSAKGYKMLSERIQDVIIR